MTSIITRIGKAGSAGEEVFSVSPEDARILLKFNTHNRKLSDNEVQKWALEMEEGRWQYNGDPVRIAVNGAILDGQHRLTALSMMPDDFRINMLFVWGLPQETQLTMDQGRRRGVADQLSLAGDALNGSEAAGLRLYILWLSHQTGDPCDMLFQNAVLVKRRLTPTYLHDWVGKNPGVLDLMHAGYQYVKIECRPRVTIAAYAAIMTRASKAPLGVVDDFFAGVLHGAELPTGSPILALRERLGNIVKSGSKMSDRDRLGMFLHTYNLWRKSNTISKIQMPNGSSYTSNNFPKVTQI
jgi:hypothetical protein